MNPFVLQSPTKSSSSLTGDDDTELMMDELLMTPPMTASTIRGLLPRYDFIEFILFLIFRTNIRKYFSGIFRMLEPYGFSDSKIWISSENSSFI